jgi:hypothetical protein
MFNLNKKVKTSSEDKMPIDTDGPIISSADLLSEMNLSTFGKVIIAGFECNILTNADSRIMIFVNLHGNTNMHIVTIGDKSTLSSPLTERINLHFLTQVKLEGNFPDYFKLYCSPDNQVEIREVLDPSSMAFLVDFCREYDLEIYKETLYISQATTAISKTESGILAKDTDKLLVQIGHVLDVLAGSNESPTT